MIPHSLACAAVKGGAGKSSLISSLGAIAAASGWRVLLVDLDPQGNQAREFGYMAESDGGRGLFNSVLTEVPLAVLHDVRPRLDVVAGGRHTRRLANWLIAESRDDESVVRRVDEVLSSVAGDYDVVLIDSPPGDFALHAAMAAVSHYYVIPTQGDSASSDGIAEVLARIEASRTGHPPLNPALELLGLVVMFVPTSGTVIDRRIRADLRSLLGDDATIFSPSIRFSKQAAIDVRERGVVPSEYEVLKRESEQNTPWYVALRNKGSVERFSSAASGLAEDYQRLTEAILGRFRERQLELGF